MVENSCCRALYETCAGNTDEMQLIQKSRNALVDLYINMNAMIFLNMKNPEKTERMKAYNKIRPYIQPARDAVKALNQLCANKKVDYVFKGKPAKTKDVYKFAQKISDEIISDMMKTITRKDG